MSKLLLDERPLIILPNLARAIGLNEAIVLQQLHYWLVHYKNDKSHKKDGKIWIYNTIAAWQDNFPWWSARTVHRALLSLSKKYEPKEEEKKRGRVKRGALIIIGKYNKAGFDRTNWYTIDYDELDKIDGSGTTMMTDCHDGDDNLSSPIPETTPETTTDISPNGEGAPPQSKRTRKKSERDIAVSQLEAFFSMQRGTPIPQPTTAQQKKEAAVRWWNPLWDIYATHCNKDIEQARRVISHAIAKLLKDRVTVSAPQSIHKTCISLAADENRQKKAEQPTESPAELAARLQRQIRL